MKLRKILSCVLLISLMMLVFAGCAPAAGADAGAGAGGAASSLIMIAVIFVVFYFLMIRPENKRKKKAQEMRDTVAAGDKITTIGGIVGKVVHVSGDKITFETSEDRVRLEVMKWAISSNDGKGADKETADSEETLES